MNKLLCVSQRTLNIEIENINKLSNVFNYIIILLMKLCLANHRKNNDIVT